MKHELKISDPCPIEYMEMKNPQNTICEVLREIYHLTDDPVIKLRLRVATTIAKKMSKKLSEYNWNWENEFYK
jgi:hypothetical protein